MERERRWPKPQADEERVAEIVESFALYRLGGLDLVCRGKLKTRRWFERHAEHRRPQ